MRVVASRQPTGSGRKRRRGMLLLALSGLCTIGATANAQQSPPAITFTIERFQVDGDNPLSAAQTEHVLAPFLGPQQGISGVEEAARALEQALVKRGFAFHRVTVPPQRASGGVFQLRITSYRVASIEVNGNDHFSDDSVRGSLPALRLGEPPNSRRIARSLKQSNEHPARRVAVFLSEAEQAGDLHARIEVRDAKPWQMFGSLANTGSRETGDWRLSLGAQHSGLWGRDHVLTMSYTTSPPEHLEDVNQIGISYRIPVYRFAGSIDAYFSHSDVAQGVDTTGVSAFDVSGAGRFLGVAYTQNLFPLGNYNHSVRLALDDRLFENNTINLAFPTLDFLDVRSRPLSLQYTGRYESGGVRYGVHAVLSGNLGGGAYNNNLAYQANRCGIDLSGLCNPATGLGTQVDHSWQVLRIGGNVDLPLWGKWQFRGRLESQLAGEPLIPGEQLGLGGVNSIRGFKEREIAGESGVQLNAELHTPPLYKSLQLLAFADFGALRVIRPDDNSLNGETLVSVGVGLRWFFRNFIGISLDYAHVLDGNGSRANPAVVAVTRSDADYLHFNLFMRY
ncbi:MAG: ShlB/FhaC/HecB family hemolysin secretion/activation protein [Gammaproteobacteria bacterium]|nr:ShlB/FhaC/HecB family hemolysin secretion/activation protein [Gammaproteobacteria bacterium]